MNKRAGLLATIGLGLVVVADGALAQHPSRTFHATARVGVYVPRSDLSGYVFGYPPLRHRREGPYAAFGVAAEMNLPVRALTLSGTIEYVPSIDVGVDACYPDGPCLFVVLPDSEAELLVASADVVVRPFQAGLLVPYLLGGLGLRDYSGALDSTDLALHLGVGLDLRLTDTISAVLELSECISEFDGFDMPLRNPTQHDLSLMAGLRVGVI